MAEHGAQPDFNPATTGHALKEVIAQRAKRSSPPLRFAVVHPFSGHNYELRYWLAACGIDPTRDIEIVIVPPPLMVDALAGGTIDGYCVGEPWNTAGALLGHGHIATVKAAIWRSSPEKVLGASAQWAHENPDALAALLRALCKSAQWCGDAAHRDELAELLSSKAYLAQPAAWMMQGLSGNLHASEADVRSAEDFFVPFAKAATFPWKSHALWFYSQMVRWGQVKHDAETARIARETYRPDLYRAALKALGVALPVANAKVEGALETATPVGSAGASLVLGPDGFFDGGLFDPDKLDAYIESQKR
jgi:NitT/TauT family transport system ATP-binding protein